MSEFEALELLRRIWSSRYRTACTVFMRATARGNKRLADAAQRRIRELLIEVIAV